MHYERRGTRLRRPRDSRRDIRLMHTRARARATRLRPTRLSSRFARAYVYLACFRMHRLGDARTYAYVFACARARAKAQAEVTRDEPRSHGPPEATSIQTTAAAAAATKKVARAPIMGEEEAHRVRSNLAAALRLIGFNDRESTNRQDGSINPLIPSTVTGHA